MGFWNKLGKIALTAAPYVAAPFTGGASLAFAPMAKQAVGAWSQKDAEKNAAKGLAPSSFDRYIGMAGDVAGMASSAGAMGKFGAGKYDDGSGAGSSWQDKLKGVLGGQDPYQYRTPPYVSDRQGGSARFGGAYAGNSADSGDTSYINDAISGVSKSGQGGKGGVSGFIDKLGGAKGIAGIAGGVAGGLALKKYLNRDKGEDIDRGDRDIEPRALPEDAQGVSRFQGRMRRELGPIMGQSNQNNPNLALSIGQGRMDAMRDQPFRGGYDVRTQVDSDEETGDPIYEYREMPRIGPGRRRRQDRYYGQREEAAQ